MSGRTEWPEWLTPEYTAMQTAVINAIVSALDHCYASEDACAGDGRGGWTEEGWMRIASSNIIGVFKRAGFTPPAEPFPPAERRTLASVREQWEPEYDLEPTCDSCGARDAEGIELVTDDEGSTFCEDCYQP